MSTRPPRRRQWGWKGLALVIVLVAGFFIPRGFFRRLPESYPPNAFYQVQRADMLISILEEGALRALNETVVRSSLEGFNRIIHLAPEGSYVQKGDLLVELDRSGLKDRLNEQEMLHQDRLFQMLQAKGNLNIQKSLVESQLKEAELRVENAQSDLEKYREGDAPLLIRTVAARAGVLAEQVRIAGERSSRTEELFKAGNATRSEVEADALSLKREQLALGQYQEDLRLITKYDQPKQVRLLQATVEQAQAERIRLQQRTSNEIAQAEADLKTSQGALDFIEEGIDTLRERLKSTRILAPQNGLVVYAQVSPFQMGDGDGGRREEGRFRGGGPSGGRGSGDSRGGGRRGGRGNSDSENGARDGSTVAAVAETVADGNQRIASAVGTAISEPGAAGNSAGSGGGSAASGGGRSASGGGTGGGQTASSAAGAFASYPSMRPASLLGAATTIDSSRSSASAGAADSPASATGASAPSSIANPLSVRASSQNYRDFGGYEMYGTPGVLEAGLMVRQRQELIRLPDVSKMLAEITIEESRAAQVKAGMTAFVQVRNIPERRFQGTVRRVALLPDSQSSWMTPAKKVFPADVFVDEELPLLKPGVSASVEVIITNLTQVLSVPLQTVARLQGENVCFLKKGSRVAPVVVTTGWFNDAFVEIKSGLNEGDLVLLAPVGDKEEEAPAETESGRTNLVGPAAISPRPPPMAEPPVEGRRFRPRDSEPTGGEAAPESLRPRPGSGRRSQNPRNAPE